MLQYCIKQIKTNINKYILHVLLNKLRDKLYFSCSIPTPGFPHFYYMLGANLGLLLYGEVSVMRSVSYVCTDEGKNNALPNFMAGTSCSTDILQGFDGVLNKR